MKKNNRYNAAVILVAVGTSFILSACNAEMSGPDVQNPPFLHGGGGGGHTDSFDNLIAGPSLDGTWKSKCVEDSRENHKWDLINFTASGQNVTRLTKWFKDENCTQSAGEKNEIGRFRYLRKNTRGDFEIEYSFKMHNGTYTQYETVNFKDKTLLISNEIGGEGTADVPLTQDGAPKADVVSAQDFLSHVPTIGDEVVYVGKSAYGLQTETYSNSGYFSDDNSWSVFHDIEPGAYMGYDHYSSLWSTAQTDDLLKNCEAKGGTLETVTVKAGTFPTCVITDERAKIWYGNVPIWGFVKIQFNDGSYSSELRSYVWADSLTHQN